MSTRIVDQFAAVLFPASEMREHLPHWSFYDDHYIFLELGGDNNLFGRHPRTGRDVRHRRWDLAAYGVKYRVMQTMIGYSRAAEGGCLRFSGDGDTMPETYIRKARNTLDAALPAAAFRGFGFSFSAEIEIPAGQVIEEFEQKQVDELTALVAPVSVDGSRRWLLNPFWDQKHAAAFFAYAHLDKRSVPFKAKVSGLEFADIPLMRRASHEATQLSSRAAA